MLDTLEPVDYQGLDHLKYILNRSLGPETIDSWGTAPGSRPIEDLYRELGRYEAIIGIANGEIMRMVIVAAADVLYAPAYPRVLRLRSQLQPWMRLVERSQILPGGRTRERNLEYSLGGKVQWGEGHGAAIVREVRQETGIMSGFSIYGRPASFSRIVRDSQSYPGLSTLYTFYPYWVLFGREVFSSEGYVTPEGGGETRSCFEWEPMETAPSLPPFREFLWIKSDNTRPWLLDCL